MLGTQNISDVELKQRWRLYWIHCIFEFSSMKLQRMSWIEGDEANWPEGEVWASSFEECIAAYFDNLALDDAYVKAIEAGNVSEEEALRAQTFHQLAYLFIEPSEDPEEILKDPEWIEIVAKAKVFWDYLKTHVTAQREKELMEKLEKDFA
ncbi:MAG: hypothetical protein GQ531_06920 [Sulfurovum sp.]|nr:hypothetical protein [Sulfurovum sp.]